MSINSNIELIQKNIDEAIARSGRSRESVTLIAVTKTKPIEDMVEALQSGIFHVGENKVQEIRTKYEVFKDAFKWHMIGHLQTNKVKYIIDKVALIHSVDSLKLAEKIDEEAGKWDKVMDILLQVNLAGETTKFGLHEKALVQLLEPLSKLKNIKVRGLMTIPPYTDDPETNRPYFKELKKISVDINKQNIDNITMDILSMGMTGDYVTAIEEGATMIRIGTAIFGERNYNS